MTSGRVKTPAAEQIPWPRLAERINELGGLWLLSRKDVNTYSIYYNALTKNQNPTLHTIQKILNLTGLTFEEAFSIEKE